MQLYRITDHYGAALLQEPPQQDTASLQPLQKPEDVVYAMADGSMVLTREEKWKEAKLGRLFRGQDCLHSAAINNCITQSQYISHFGDSSTFTQKMDRALDRYGPLDKRLIFITDGAVWLRNWITDAYPDAVSILDFYHAKEYLCDFAKACFTEEQQRHRWIEEQASLMLQSGTAQVIEQVQALAAIKPVAAAEKLINYYTENRGRMDYRYYQTIGKGLIGSGAIESAHRTVIQCRMKLSGQRWSKKGAANMLCLRTIRMNKQWPQVVHTIKSQYQPKAAA